MSDNGEIYIYAPSAIASADEAVPADPSPPDDPFVPKGFGLRKHDDGLTAVTISDDELLRLKAQVGRIADALADAKSGSGSGGYSVDSITAHLGISASGRFFFIAEAGVEASIEVTWKRNDSGK
jgi:hypothetical protein